MDDSLEARIVELEERLAAKPDAIKKKAGRVVEEVLDALDTGKLRVCEPTDDGWVVHPWVKRAILLSFGRFDNARIVEEAFADTAGPLDALQLRYRLPSYYDKLPTKRNWKKLGARCVPGGIARYGSYLGKGAILMPGFVNIGAYVDDGTMVDTWATVGSCAQIGKDVHLSGGVGIGGVLEPPQAMPVIVEDGAFVGSRCIVVEGVRVGREAVLGAGVVLTASTPIVDVRGAEPVVTKGADPAARGRDPGHAAQALRRRRVRDAVRADHRRAQRTPPTRRRRSTPRCASSRSRSSRMNPRVDAIEPSSDPRDRGEEEARRDRSRARRADAAAAAAVHRRRRALGGRARREVHRERGRPRLARAHRRALRVSRDVRRAQRLRDDRLARGGVRRDQDAARPVRRRAAGRRARVSRRTRRWRSSKASRTGACTCAPTTTSATTSTRSSTRSTARRA